MITKDAKPFAVCEFNAGVECNEKLKRCACCGWNPDVEEKRGNKRKRARTPARYENLIFTARWR